MLRVGHNRGEDGRQCVVDRAEDLVARTDVSTVTMHGLKRSNAAVGLGGVQSWRRSADGNQSQHAGAHTRRHT